MESDHLVQARIKVVVPILAHINTHFTQTESKTNSPQCISEETEMVGLASYLPSTHTLEANTYWHNTRR
jgi:hypothetical protein